LLFQQELDTYPAIAVPTPVAKLLVEEDVPDTTEVATILENSHFSPRASWISVLFSVKA
jgi:hypothetical protein